MHIVSESLAGVMPVGALEEFDSFLVSKKSVISRPQRDRRVPTTPLLCDPTRVVPSGGVNLRFAASFSSLLLATLFFPADALRGERMPPRRLPGPPELLQPTADAATTAVRFRFALPLPTPRSCVRLPGAH
ncbi:hypothetical protein NDU88_002290 [Pleurodeles waltl]|uniref:Uncharacterized protein n=1 Tax=Pleurodeles waltl TaxID=8319 RepID=A0AAV7NDC0_PLEWA|nr:hypothetical protein NDU88_002290 [Pleurodeles waltl]